MDNRIKVEGDGVSSLSAYFRCFQPFGDRRGLMFLFFLNKGWINRPGDNRPALMLEVQQVLNAIGFGFELKDPILLLCEEFHQ